MSDSGKRYKFSVDMTCEGCSGAVTRVLGKVQGQGVESFEIDLPNKIVMVRSTLPKDQILEIIRKTGKTTEFLGEA